MSKQQVLERERARSVPAGIAAFAAVALLIVSFVSRAQIPAPSGAGAQFVAFNDHAGALVFSAVISAIGFGLFCIPLAFLFTAARARSPRVQPAMIALCFIGPILIGAQGVINGIGLKQAAADYVAKPPEQSKTFAQFRKDLSASPPTLSKVSVYTDDNRLEIETIHGDFYSVSYPQGQEKDLIGSTDEGTNSVDTSVADTSLLGKSDVDTSVTTDGKVGDAEATKTAEDNSTVTLATNVIFPAALAMIGAVVYTALWAYRVGLLTRFFGTLGMALGAALILLPQAPIFLALWLGWLGLIFIDRVPNGRPPAWDAGEAVPWPAPGQQQRARAERDSDAVEGTGREATETGGNGAGASGGPTQKRKRKRRR